MPVECFRGCKLALFEGNRLLDYKRDERDDIPFPGMWDLPGGGREGEESPEECVLRELQEEFGITLFADRLIYRRRYEIEHPLKYAYFFAAKLRTQEVGDITFGDEGQYWELMDVQRYLAHSKVPERHKLRLFHYLDLTGQLSA